MTYGIGMYLKDGLVFLSDSRTNAGVDDISTFGKMTVWEREGDRVLTMLTAGNLAISQAIINQLNEGLARPGKEAEDERDTIYNVPTMFQAARLVGRTIREVQKLDAPHLAPEENFVAVSAILGGQIKGQPPSLFLMYKEGNFIQATADTPFLQIGETKYGKPILDRVLRHETPLAQAVKVGLISLDSTMRSNISVGLPLDMLIYRTDSFKVANQYRLDSSDRYFKDLRRQWSKHLQDTFNKLPNPDWLNDI